MSEAPARRAAPLDTRRLALHRAAVALASTTLPLGSEAPAMRKPGTVRQVDPLALPPPPPVAVIALSRMGFGPRPGDVAAFNALGGDDLSRLTAYVDQQLSPATIDDSAAQARLALSGFTTLGKSLTQLWQDHHVADPVWEERVRPFLETEMAAFVRAIHSRRQLLEVLVDFWHNHFNVYAYEFLTAPIWVHTDRDVIRAHALGNFRQMLEAVATSPAMLYYLNNSVNSVDGPNENYAREFLELHTLGAENYFGSIPAAQVPRDGTGLALGYCDEDVTAVARCLTGWTLRDRWWDPNFGNTGEFFYYAPWHDTGAKTVLGRPIAANQPAMKDGRDVLDLVASHPATARFLAKKLLRRLVMDQPPVALVESIAQVFLANTAAPDQLKRVVRAILLTPEFRTTWGQKTKRPFELTVSMFRAAQGDLPFQLNHDHTGWFQWMYYQAGQPLYQWHPPNGFPDIKEAWKTTSPKVMCWRLANFLVELERPNNGGYYINLLGQVPPGVRSARAIVNFWADRLLGSLPVAVELDEWIEFMAQGRNPDFNLPLDTDDETRDRMRALVALIFMSPSFHWR